MAPFDTGSRFRLHGCGPLCAHSTGPGLSRRGILRASLVGAATLLSPLAAPSILRAQTPPVIPAIAAKNIVDVHHHFVPPAYRTEAGEALAASGVFNFPPYANWTPQTTLEEMDRNNVRTAMLSISTPGIWFGDNEKGRKIARLCNDYAAGMARDYKGRFGQFASIPLPDVDGALAETAYALDTLGADGICLMTSYNGRYLGDPGFAPVFAELNRRRAVVFVHPNNPTCCAGIADDVDPSFIEFPSDSTRTIMSLLYSGEFAKYPDIRFIFCHNGGTLPILIGRIMQLGHSPMAAKRVPPDTIPAELRRHYYEVANSANNASVNAVMQFADPTHMLFGSDYPYVPVGATEGGLLKLGLDPAELQAILRDNATRLLPGIAS